MTAMSQFNKIEKVMLYEPRSLFRNAARYCLEDQGCKVTEIYHGRLVEEAFASDNHNAVIAIGLTGAGEEIYSLLRVIHILSAQNQNLLVWLPERDNLLSYLVHGLDVHSLLCETRLEEELSQWVQCQTFTSLHFPSRINSVLKGGRRSKLSESELDMIIDFSRGLSANDIAHSRHSSYKTVFTHKRNAQQRLNFDSSVQWLDLLTRLQQLRSI